MSKENSGDSLWKGKAGDCLILFFIFTACPHSSPGTLVYSPQTFISSRASSNISERTDQEARLKRRKEGDKGKRKKPQNLLYKL